MFVATGRRLCSHVYLTLKSHVTVAMGGGGGGGGLQTVGIPSAGVQLILLTCCKSQCCCSLCVYYPVPEVKVQNIRTSSTDALEVPHS